MTDRIHSRASIRLLLLLAISAPGAAQTTKTVILKAIEDASVSSATPTATNGDARTLAIAASNLFGRAASTDSYLRFQMPTVPNAVVTRVRLVFQVSNLNGSSAFRVQEVASPWTEKALTFNIARSLPKGGNLMTVTASLGRNDKSASELIALVQKWIRDPKTNNGIVFTMPTAGRSSASSVFFSSSENGNGPQLEVVFSSVRIPTQRFPRGVVGKPFSAVLRAAKDNVASVEWNEKVELPAGLTARQVGDELRIEGTPKQAFSEKIEFSVRDPKTGSTDAREIALIITEQGAIRLENGTPDLAGRAFRRDVSERIEALVTKVTNESETEVSLEKLSVFVAGSGDNVTQLQSIAVFFDRDSNGVINTQKGDFILGVTSALQDNSSIELAMRSQALSAGQTKQFVVVLQTKRDCPPGVEFAVTIQGGSALDAKAGNGLEIPVLAEFLQGPSFFCETRAELDGDTNGDGRVDCLDLQILARQIGQTPSQLPDLDGSGILDRTDVQILTDAVLDRPVVTSITQSASGNLTVSGFELGTGVDNVEIRIDGVAVPALFSSDGEKVVRLPKRGAHEVQILVGDRRSTARKFDVQ